MPPQTQHPNMQHTQQTLDQSFQRKKIDKHTLLNHPDWTTAHSVIAGTHIMGWTKAKNLTTEERQTLGLEYNCHAYYAWERNFIRTTDKPGIPKTRIQEFGWYLQAHGDYNPTSTDYESFALLDKLLEKLQKDKPSLKMHHNPTTTTTTLYQNSKQIAKRTHSNRRIALCHTCLQAANLPDIMYI